MFMEMIGIKFYSTTYFKKICRSNRFFYFTFHPSEHISALEQDVDNCKNTTKCKISVRMV